MNSRNGRQVSTSPSSQWSPSAVDGEKTVVPRDDEDTAVEG